MPSSWCVTASPNEWLQIDLGLVLVISAITTQGDYGRSSKDMVSIYQLSYSNYSQQSYIFVKEGSQIKVSLLCLDKFRPLFFAMKITRVLAEVPSVALVLNGFSVDTVYSIFSLYPPEHSLSCSLLFPPSLVVTWSRGPCSPPWRADSCWIQNVKVCIPSSLTWSRQGINGRVGGLGT